MSRSTTRNAVAVVLGVVLLNVLLRILPLPDVDVDLPSLPGWVHTLATIKNVAFGVLIALVVAGFVVREIEAHRRRDDG